MARPTKLTPETQQNIVQAIRVGATYELAAQFGGVSYQSFNGWCKRGRIELERRENGAKPDTKQWKDEEPFVQFLEAVKRAEGQAAVGWLAKIEAAANDGNWQAAAWKLERRYPGEYGRIRHEVTGADGGALEIVIRHADS